MAATKKIPADVLGVIASMNIEQHGDEGSARIARIIDGQLPRDLYVGVDKVLKMLGGKWNRKAGGHLFLDDPSDAIDACVQTGEVTDKKQALQFFETPEALADELVKLADIRDGMRVLEPSAGRGRIVRAIKKVAPVCTLFAVEINPVNYSYISDSSKYPKHIFIDDFMTLDFTDIDRVVANPPFSKRQDVDHITRAYSMLRSGGRLVSVVSGNAMHRIDKKGAAFRKLVESCGSYRDLPEGAFKESGTMVRAGVVTLDKE